MDPIVIDSDEDESQVAGPSSSRFNDLSSSVRANGSTNGTSSTADIGADSRDAIRIALAKLDAEIKSVEEQLRPLQTLHTQLKAERSQLESQLSYVSQSQLPKTAKADPRASTSTIDFQSSNFGWSDSIRSVLKAKFGLKGFRLCQEGVINAAMDGRDIVCVMPTGGGKSLTYQLPAVSGSKGLTVVISPLLALIWDQVRSLKELNIECAMLTGSTSKEEQNAIYQRIEGSQNAMKELRLCYMTPEKVSKSKRLMAALEKANAGGRLKRFVIDEAHCCSQLGHDFRPDYKKLSMLRTLFPRVPIQAVTATLSSKTMPDLLKILRLPPVCDGRAANSSGTVFFSAPLFRPNLHYQVLPKPSSSKAAMEKMGDWIQKHHPAKSGIIYCFSKKDADTVAESLRECSNGAIKTGVYHAGIEDWEKERIHLDWRKGKVNCICATIAFGLGIDKGDVRYVIHHSVSWTSPAELKLTAPKMSKSLDGYYQETGRAGRDGDTSDCVLFYRGQDAARLSSMIYGDIDGSSKLQEMLKFAQDLKTCRKVAFAKYFSASTHLSAAAWDNPDALGSSGGTITTCGICDNCLRHPASITTKDVTIESWICLKALEEIIHSGGRVTLANLSDLVRGLGGGSYGTLSEGKGRKRKSGGEKATLDLDEVAGGKVTLNKDDTEVLLIHLLLLGYLDDSYSATAYSVNVYSKLGPKALRLTRCTKDQIESGNSPRVECTFVNPKATAGRKASKKAGGELVTLSDEEEEPKKKQAPKKKPRKVKGEEYDSWDEKLFGEGEDGFLEGHDEVEDESDGEWEVTKGAASGAREATSKTNTKLIDTGIFSDDDH